MTKLEDEEEEASTNFWLYVMLVAMFFIGCVIYAPLNMYQMATDPVGVVIADILGLGAYGLILGLLIWANNTE